MRVFSENIKDFEGETIKACIIHKIYGSHKIKVCGFTPLCTESKIGFVVNGHEIFSCREEIEDVVFNENECRIIGKMQTIIIEK